MSSHAFIVCANRAAPIANDIDPNNHYRAEARWMPAGTFSDVFVSKDSEVVLFVERGTLEIMIEGAVGNVSAGHFARVPVGRHYAYRNPGHEIARVLSRPVKQANDVMPTRVIAEIAAA